jgi:hypothetical protein
MAQALQPDLAESAIEPKPWLVVMGRTADAGGGGLTSGIGPLTYGATCLTGTLEWTRRKLRGR